MLIFLGSGGGGVAERERFRRGGERERLLRFGGVRRGGVRRRGERRRTK